MLADDEGLQKKLGISDVAEEHPCLLEEDDTGLIESLAFLLLEGDNLAFLMWDQHNEGTEGRPVEGTLRKIWCYRTAVGLENAAVRKTQLFDSSK